MNSMEANAAQNAAQREMDALREPIIGTREQVLLYWYQARNDIKNSSGDKGVIESISVNPVKVVFANESIKAKILADNENLFRFAYVVDVFIETMQGRPALYKILNVHTKIDRSS